MKQQQNLSHLLTSQAGMLLAIFGALLPSSVHAQATTELISVISASPNGNYDCWNSIISATGRFVGFISRVTSTSPYNGYLYDRQTQATELIVTNGSVDSISPDGRFVAFTSDATDLVPGDTNNARDVFIRDRQTHSTERVSVGAFGVQGNGESSYGVISADGRYVAFGSGASNLVTGDTNNARDVFVRDRQTGTTERVSVSSIGSQSNGDALSIALSPDGRYVAFTSWASNLILGDANNHLDVFLHDRGSHTTERVSIGSAGEEGNLNSEGSSVSADGRYVAFTSLANTLIPGDTGGGMYIRDRLNGTLERVDVSSQGEKANAITGGLANSSFLSAEGRFVVFQSSATNLVPNLTTAVWRVYIRDRVNHTTNLVSLASDGSLANGPSVFAAISADGQHVSFSSRASNLVVPNVTKGTTQIYSYGPLILPSCTVSGTITLEDIVHTATPQPLTLTFRPTDNSGDIMKTASVGPNGAFSVTDIPRTAYTLHIKGSKWLARNVAVNTSNGDVTNVNKTLPAGDANNDNAVDVLDLDALIQAFDSTSTDEDWNPNADFNCDGSVDVLDLDILIRNFDRAGDS